MNKTERATVVNVRRGGECDVYIGRQTRRFARSVFENGFKIGPGFDREQSIAAYRSLFYSDTWHGETLRSAAIERLRGKRLGCWCAPLPCHGDVLAEFVNRDRS
jgi:hypothetical protein